MTVTVRIGAFVAGVQNSQEITHEKSLVGCGSLAAAFVSTTERLGEKLGPLLLQLPPAFGVEGLPLRGRGAPPRLVRLGRRRDAARAGGLVPVDHPRMPRLEEATVEELACVRWPSSTLAQLMEIRRRSGER